MKYKIFKIKNYRAITEEIEIDLEKNSLTPIIGINESGKTTVLQAIFAFDSYNDQMYDGAHIKDTNNLYDTENRASIISAVIDISENEFKNCLLKVEKHEKFEEIKFNLNKYKTSSIKNNSLIISRNLHTKSYSINNDGFSDKKLNNILSKEIIKAMPYIFYFDDFRDSINDTIYIKTKSEEINETWLSIIEQLFFQTDKKYSVYGLKDEENRKRKSIISKVKSKLNKTLTNEWQNFRLDDSEALKIDIEFIEENNSIKLGVIETDTNGDEHYFYIRDRSKGFFWFFNFVMKLEFNPKGIGPIDSNSIYLLDEPGSYLHASAQNKLAKKLMDISASNKVIYCTHSHYLLNPEIIPINSVRIADKNDVGSVKLLNIDAYNGDISDRKSAFQPILDSLQIKPYLLDLTSSKILLTEGIYDYYCFEMFKGNNDFNVLPGVGADSIKFYISFMILAQKEYKAVWDNDTEGLKGFQSATKYFGEEEAKKFFILEKNNKKSILQDLFDSEELVNLKKSIGLEKKTSFNKVILKFYYSKNKTEIISKMPKTKQNFDRNINKFFKI